MKDMPVMIELEPIRIAYDTEKQDFDNWKTIHVDGEVSFDQKCRNGQLRKVRRTIDQFASM